MSVAGKRGRRRPGCRGWDLLLGLHHNPFPAFPWRGGIRGLPTQFGKSLSALRASEEDDPSVTAKARQLPAKLIRSVSPLRAAQPGSDRAPHSGVSNHSITALRRLAEATGAFCVANACNPFTSSFKKMMRKQAHFPGRGGHCPDIFHMGMIWSLSCRWWFIFQQTGQLALLTGRLLENGAASHCALEGMEKLASRPSSLEVNMDASSWVPLSGDSASLCKISSRPSSSALKRESLPREAHTVGPFSPTLIPWESLVPQASLPPCQTRTPFTLFIPARTTCGCSRPLPSSLWALRSCWNI